MHQVFTPLISQPPSVRVAAVTTPATSEPKSGSVTATAPMTSAVASLGSHVLLLLLGAAVDEGPGRGSPGRVISDPPAPSDPHDSSSVATTMPR